MSRLSSEDYYEYHESKESLMEPTAKMRWSWICKECHGGGGNCPSCGGSGNSRDEEDEEDENDGYVMEDDTAQISA